MKYLYVILLLIASYAGKSQSQYTLKNAIDTALKNNFDILIARDNFDINRISNTYGMAGGLPSVNITTGDNNLNSTIHQQYSSGPDLNRQNVYGNSMNGALSAGITLFNGFKVMATKHQLEALKEQSELMLNSQIQNTMAAVFIKYFDIVRQENYQRILKKSLDVSQEKLTIITARKSVGMANDADYLQAQIDVSAVVQNIKSQQLVIDQAKTDLQLLMHVKSYDTFTITDSIEVDKTIALDSIINGLQRNPQYLSFDMQIKINQAIVQQMNSQRYPSLKINTSYNYSHLNNGAGTLVVNQSYGPQAGFTLQIPIYNGNQYKIQRDVALYNVEIAKLQKEQLLSSFMGDAIKTYQSYKTTLQQLEEQQANYELSGKLVYIVMQRFQVNLATILEVKAAQLSFENAGYLLVNLQYGAKASEIELKRLVYQLK